MQLKVFGQLIAVSGLWFIQWRR